ncbi:MAG: pyridoxal phosphate-dependent aminotransferase [Chloroflexi bacterium]|nr:pyridoxal phosphate-dependent aminotransferase [Chloroflexota bacterium]
MSVPDKIRKGIASGSLIRRAFEEGILLKQRYGEANIFDLSLGNPVMEPPAAFVRELQRLASSPQPGLHRYMPNAGYAETRAAVAANIASETGLNFTLNEIVMTCGAAGALNVVLKTIVDDGDEVILFAPYFAEYVHYIAHCNGVARIVPTDDQFRPDLTALEAAINARTKAVIINSPNNPTGAVYDEGVVRRIGELLRRKESELGTEIYLISDEAYRKIIFDGFKYPPIWPHHAQSIVVTSHSKDLALPGERIGYIAIHPDCRQKGELLDGFIYCNRTLGFVNAPALMQHIVRNLQNVTVDVNEYQRKRDFLYRNLTEMGYSLVKPQGAFYIFPKSPLADDLAFVKELQQQWQVLTVPGSGFGLPGYFRISYCVDDRTLEGSLNGFRKAAQKYKR